MLGGTGYVAGELLRLLAAHPHFELAAVMSDSQPGEPVAAAFPHLAGAYPDDALQLPGRGAQAAVRARRSAAVFSAAPHGVAGALDRPLLRPPREAPARAPRVVDISADFRYARRRRYAAGLQARARSSGAPGGVHLRAARAPARARARRTSPIPGCFATAMLLASVPLLA